MACALAFSTLVAGTISGQQRPVLRAHPATGIVLDGLVGEPAWLAADSIANLTQIEPREGGAPSARTVVRVLADPRNLYVAVVAHDPRPDAIVSFSKARDSELRGQDHVQIVLDTYLDGRSGYTFSVNPGGARFDALVGRVGERSNPNWDGAWEAATRVSEEGWSAEIRIPVRSLGFDASLREWGLNVQRRIERLQETDRWASPELDYAVTQTSRAGRLNGLPRFDLGMGLTVTPSIVGGVGVPEPGAATDVELEPSLDVTQRVGANLLLSGTANTDFAETEVDTRQTNLTRFPLFFPEKRAFFLEGADIFDFGFLLGEDVIPFFSRRIGLVEQQEVALQAGVKVNGRVGETNLGALAVRTRAESGLTPATEMGVVRVARNVLEQSTAGVLATLGDPLGRGDAWLAGTDFTYRTTSLFGDKSFAAGVWGLAMGRDGLEDGDRTAVGVSVDYPNDLWDLGFTYKRVGEAFEPSLGFVPRRGVHILDPFVTFQPRFDWSWLRLARHEIFPRFVWSLSGELESYRVFTAPINHRLESGDRIEFNPVWEGERLDEPFEIAEGVVIPPGSYDWLRWRPEVDLASKRRVSGRVSYWFGEFYGGTLEQLIGRVQWLVSPTLVLELSGEHDVGDLPQGEFTKDLARLRLEVNLSPDLQVNSFVQYDNESETLGSNSRLRWTFDPYGDAFVVYNHNVREASPGEWRRESNQLLLKIRYGLPF